MPHLDIYLAQLTDPFRIGLLIALVLTAANTAQALNRWIPIALGIVFVAVLIPFSIGANATVDATTSVLVGLVANATILAVLLAAKALYSRLA
jgi:cobalamin biosynthesis protein CobD/CbiB